MSLAPPQSPHFRVGSTHTSLPTGYDEEDHYLREFRTVRALPMLRSMCSRNAVLEEMARNEGQDAHRNLTEMGKLAESRWWRRFSHYERAMLMQGGPPQNVVQTALAERAEMNKAGRMPSFRLKTAARGATGQRPATAGSVTRARSPSIHKQPELVGSSVATIKPLVRFHRSLIEQRMQNKRQLAVAQPCLSEAGFNKAEWDGTPLERALAKITKKSRYYDPVDKRNRRALEGFDGPKLSYADFRHQLRMSLGVKLAKDEVEALAQLFDPEAQGYISGAEFSRHFTRAGITARQEERTERMRETHEKADRARRAQKETERLDYEELMEDVCDTFVEADRTSALDKLRHLAGTWDAGYTEHRVNLAAFSSKMSMKEFRDQLTKSFGIKMTPAEMGALRDTYDRDGNGFINGSEFHLWWFKLAEEKHATDERERQTAITRRTRLTVRTPAPSLLPTDIDSGLSRDERKTLRSTISGGGGLDALRAKYAGVTSDGARPVTAPPNGPPTAQATA